MRMRFFYVLCLANVDVFNGTKPFFSSLCLSQLFQILSFIVLRDPLGYFRLLKGIFFWFAFRTHFFSLPRISCKFVLTLIMKKKRFMMVSDVGFQDCCVIFAFDRQMKVKYLSSLYG